MTIKFPGDPEVCRCTNHEVPWQTYYLIDGKKICVKCRELVEVVDG